MKHLRQMLVAVLDRPEALLCALLSLVPPVTVAFLIQSNAVNVPFWDQWDSGYLIALEASRGTLTLGDLITQYNEHRMFASYSATAVSVWLTRWDTRFEMWVTFALAIGSLLMALAIIRSSTPQLAPFVALPFSFLVFSVGQWLTWVWGFQTNYLFVITSALAAFAIVSVNRPGWRPLAAAALFAALGMSSMVPGILIWPIVIAGMWLMGYRNRAHYVFWLVVAAVSVAAFFSDFRVVAAPGGEPALDLMALAHYQGVYLSNTLFRATPIETDAPVLWLTTLLAVALLAANALYLGLIRRQPRAVTPWLMVSAYIIGWAILNSLKRSQLTLAQAHQSYYISATLWFWIALIAMIAQTLLELKARSQRSAGESALGLINIAALATLAIPFALGVPGSLNELQRHSMMQRANVECMAAYPITGDDGCLVGLYPRVNEIEPRILELEAQQLGPFAPGWLPQVALASLMKTQSDGARVTELPVNGATSPVTLQRPSTAIDVAARLPSSIAMWLTSGASIETINPLAAPDPILFQVTVIPANGAPEVVASVTVSSSPFSAPMWIRADLSAYRGQAIQLRLEAIPQNGPTLHWAIWVNPTLIPAPTN